MLRKLKLPIIGLVFVLANQAVGFAVHAAMPDAFLAQGTTRYAVAQSATSEVTHSGAWATVPGMYTTISIPAGKVGDVMGIFCGDAYADHNATALQVRAVVAGIVAAPGYVNFQNEQVVQHQCATFYRTGVGAGTNVVGIQWRSSDGLDTVRLWQRSMIVTVNIR
jgi:hypothetical protein